MKIFSFNYFYYPNYFKGFFKKYISIEIIFVTDYKRPSNFSCYFQIQLQYKKKLLFFNNFCSKIPIFKRIRVMHF